MQDRRYPKRITRRRFLIGAGAALAGTALACGRGRNVVSTTAPSGATFPSATSPSSGDAPTAAPGSTAAPVVATDVPLSRVITFNDYLPEHLNVVETVVVVVNFSGRPEQVFDLRPHWDKIFGVDDPIRQLNAYYHEVFYGQLEMQPVSTPEMGDKGYVEIELPGMPQDYTFGWLIGLESEDLDSVDPAAAQRLLLEIVSRVVEKHPEIDYQDKFMFVVLNATGNEYGRGAAGFMPTGGVEPIYDVFIGDVAQDEIGAYADEAYFRIVEDSRVVGVIDKSGYPFERYFADREAHVEVDRFLLGMALFSRDAPLSCASHDIVHGLRRKSAYAVPPEGRDRALCCLYNLPLQSQWLIGTPEHGPCDRSINCTPYIGWWDPMGDHLHPIMPREFFCGHPHGMSAFSRMQMGFVPDRCLAAADADDVTLNLSPLSAPILPAAGSDAEAVAIKVPLMPGVEQLAHIYLLLEYRRRVGESGQHADNFSIAPGDVFGDPAYDPGHASGRYINPPIQFVTDEGVLVYLVNEGMPEMPGLLYTEWYNYVVALLNPAGNDQRDDLTQAALDAGESIVVDFRTLYPDRGVPVVITVEVTERTDAFAQVRITREQV